MISKNYLETLQNELQNIKNDGLFKTERIISSEFNEKLHYCCVLNSVVDENRICDYNGCEDNRKKREV